MSTSPERPPFGRSVYKQPVEKALKKTFGAPIMSYVTGGVGAFKRKRTLEIDIETHEETRELQGSQLKETQLSPRSKRSSEERKSYQ